jgi:uncharacterized protein involved in exopolysaccharide biosynthesis
VSPESMERLEPGHRAAPDRDPELTLVGLAIPLLKHRRALFATVTAFVALMVLVARLSPRTYTADATFVAQTRPGTSSSTLAGLASQFGFSLPATDPARSPAFYADLLQSDDILRSVAQAQYTVPTDTGMAAGSLVQFFGYENRGPLRSLEQTVRHLRSATKVGETTRTGVVSVSVTVRSPVLATMIARRLLGAVNEYNVETRRSQARAEREFTGQRLQQAQSDLTAAEDTLLQFVRRNRDIRSSPELTFEQDRLSRTVAFRQQLYTAIAQAYEQARIEEVRETPAITVIDQPHEPGTANGRGTVKLAILGLALGAVFGSLLAYYREYLERMRRDPPPEFEEYKVLSRELLSEVNGVTRSLKRLGRRS